MEFTRLPVMKPNVRLVFSNIEGTTLLRSLLEFHYGSFVTGLSNHSPFLYEFDKRTAQVRDLDFEQQVSQSFHGLQPIMPSSTRWKKVAADGFFDPKKFVAVTEFALNQGWDVYAHQKTIRRAQNYRMTLGGAGNNVDWFDLKAEVQFDGFSVALPLLLNNIRDGVS